MSALPLTSDANYRKLKLFVLDATGLAFYADRDDELLARLRRRLHQTGAAGFDDYLKLLDDRDRDRSELDALVSELTIGETYFFRHREQFDALAQIAVPDLLARNAGTRALSVWSAGCATGAEPYSISIILRRQFASELAGWDVRTLGTDLNREFLARAREGRFDQWAFRATPEEVRNACFRRAGKSWVLLPEYKSGVTFAYHNLVSSPFPPAGSDRLDLIVCRNVLIYFSHEMIDTIVQRFFGALREGGWLVVGHAENIPDAFRRFRTVMADGAVLYHKTSAEVGQAVSPVQPIQWTVETACPTYRETGSVPDLPKIPPARAEAPPDADQATLDRVIRLADAGHWAQAAALCSNLRGLEKLNPRVYYYHGLIPDHLGDSAGAEAALRRAVYLNRDFAAAHYHLGVLLRERHPQRSARSLENAIRVASQFAPECALEDADGLTAGELIESAKFQLEVLKR